MESPLLSNWCLLPVSIHQDFQDLYRPYSPEWPGIVLALFASTIISWWLPALQSYPNQLDQTERHLEVQDVLKESLERDMQL